MIPHILMLILIRRRLTSTVFPYTTLFRSQPSQGRMDRRAPAGDQHALRARFAPRSEEHTAELQSRLHLVCRLLLEIKNVLVVVADILRDEPLQMAPISGDDVVQQVTPTAL